LDERRRLQSAKIIVGSDSYMSLIQPHPLESEQAAFELTADVAAKASPEQSRVKRASPSRWIIGAAEEGGAAQPITDVPPHVRRAEAAKVTQQAKAGDMVMISGLEIAALVEICDRLLNRGVTVALDAQKFPALRGLVSWREYGTDWVRLQAKGVRMPLLVARLVDIIVGLAATVMTVPVLTVLMLGIRTTSPGRAIFRSPRVGRDGTGFDLFKLRTMRTSNQPDHAARKELYRDFMTVRKASADRRLKVVDESRVTPIGRFLRRHSLDELPQFWNVVRGELSLVGPRPCLPYEWDLHEDWHRLRFRGRPGLTGLWQAYGRSRVTFEEMVLMDYCYTWRKSLLLDLRIMFRTAIVVITGEGGG
jgi:lipopolysaccharide/colanic/teichoic acid biosynthesis glycosyltransferase